MRLSRFAWAAAVPLLLLVVGTLGYHVVEGWAYFDALYMTAITLTTVGYGETHPLSQAGRVFTIFLAFGGVFSVFYAATEMIRAVVNGEVGHLLGRSRMERNLSQLRDHIIVCGYGRMGRFVCREFAEAGIPFVAIDRAAENLAALDAKHGIPLQGDATSDALLKRARIDVARALVTVVASDADNLYITMSARFLNEKLYIVARSEDEHGVEKLTRAGASRVISPYSIGGHRVAQAVLRPSVMDFIELATRRGRESVQIEEIRLGAQSRLVGKSLQELRLRQDLGVVVVVIRKPDGQMIVSPEADTKLAADDILIALGRRDKLDVVDEMARR